MVPPRTGPQSAYLWWPAMAKLQAASVLRAYSLGSCSMRQGRDIVKRPFPLLPLYHVLILPVSLQYQ